MIPQVLFIANNALKVPIFPFHLLCARLQVYTITSSFKGHWELSTEFFFFFFCLLGKHSIILATSSALFL